MRITNTCNMDLQFNIARLHSTIEVNINRANWFKTYMPFFPCFWRYYVNCADGNLSDLKTNLEQEKITNIVASFDGHTIRQLEERLKKLKE